MLLHLLIIIINAPALGLSYAGKYTNDTFEGVFKQGGMEIPMTLARQNETIKPLNRPQTPKAPLITLPKKVFKTLIKNTLAGTLSIPKNFTKNSPF
jgi:hypothetical protein